MGSPLDWWVNIVRSLGWLSVWGAVKAPTAPPMNTNLLVPEPVQEPRPDTKLCTLSFERLYYEYDNRQSSLSEADFSGGLGNEVGHMGSLEIRTVTGDQLITKRLGEHFEECKPEPSGRNKVCEFESGRPTPHNIVKVSFPGGLESKAITFDHGPGSDPITVTENPDPENPSECVVSDWVDWQKESDGKFAEPLKSVKGAKIVKSRNYVCRDWDCSDAVAPPAPPLPRARRSYPIDIRFYA